MKILGLGVPELVVLLVPVLIVVLVVALVSSNNKRSSIQPPVQSLNTDPLNNQMNAMTPQDLEHYAELYKSGALSQQEFEAIKNRFLHL